MKAKALAARTEQSSISVTRALLLSLAVLAAALIWAGMAQARPVPDTFADLVETLAPAVVNISTTQRVERGDASGRRGGRDMPFEEFFRDFFDRRGPQGRSPRAPREVSSLGSGFVIDPRGYIVTNNHVVGDATDIEVNFASGLNLPAVIVGTDEATDLAVIKVEHSEPLPVVSFGNSDDARVGDWVMAIGNPFNLGTSVTAGIISARNRDIRAGQYDDFIQTDAAINRGNSGGPLFDMDGNVIGVNTVIISPTGGSVGIGFAISSSLADSIVQQLIEYGETRRGWLGVSIQRITDELASSFGLDEARGALVAGVSDDGPAQDAGIEIGDVILEFDGKEIDDYRKLSRTVAETEIGKTVNVIVWRDGRREAVRVELGQLDPALLTNAAGGQGSTSSRTESDVDELGITVAPIGAPGTEQMKVEPGVEGVLVTDVDPDGPAAQTVFPGDVIMEVEQQPVTEPGDVSKKIQAEQAREDDGLVLLLLNRNGQISFRAVRLDEDRR